MALRTGAGSFKSSLLQHGIEGLLELRAALEHMLPNAVQSLEDLGLLLQTLVDLPVASGALLLRLGQGGEAPLVEEPVYPLTARPGSSAAAAAPRRSRR